MFGIGNQSSNSSNNSDNSDSNTSSLQQAGNNRNNQSESNRGSLHHHATNALIGINSFMANANRRQQANNNLCNRKT